MKTTSKKTSPFDTKRSIQNATDRKSTLQKSTLKFEGVEYQWSTKMERVNVIRAGIPYGSIELISKRLNKSVKSVLDVCIPQTTYNKKKSKIL